jgi:glycosyltransferase involved in cell wall biosynthesis
LASVSSQTSTSELEHVIVDGGDDAQSAEIVESYIGTVGIPVNYRRGLDKGIYDAMNIALDACHGTYCYFLNAGDVLHEDAPIGQLVARIRQDEPNWLVAPVVHRDGGGSAVLVNPHGFRASRFLMGRQPYNHQGVIFRVGMARAFGGYDLEIGFTADADLIGKFALASPPAELDSVMAVYEGGGYSADLVRYAPFEFHRMRSRRLGLVGIARWASWVFACSQYARRRGLAELAKVLRSSEYTAR